MKYLKFVVVLAIVISITVFALWHNLPHLLDWSNAGEVGYNFGTLVIIGIVIYIAKVTWDKTIASKD
jgi:hypothetical protein